MKRRQQPPRSRPKSSKKSPAPLFHALSRSVRQQLRQAYAAFVEGFREATERLRRGDFSVRFPEGSTAGACARERS